MSVSGQETVPRIGMSSIRANKYLSSRESVCVRGQGGRSVYLRNSSHQTHGAK